MHHIYGTIQDKMKRISPKCSQFVRINIIIIKQNKYITNLQYQNIPTMSALWQITLNNNVYNSTTTTWLCFITTHWMALYPGQSMYAGMRRNIHSHSIFVGIIQQSFINSCHLLWPTASPRTCLILQHHTATSNHSHSHG